MVRAPLSEGSSILIFRMHSGSSSRLGTSPRGLAQQGSSPRIVSPRVGSGSLTSSTGRITRGNAGSATGGEDLAATHPPAFSAPVYLDTTAPMRTEGGGGGDGSSTRLGAGALAALARANSRRHSGGGGGLYNVRTQGSSSRQGDGERENYSTEYSPRSAASSYVFSEMDLDVMEPMEYDASMRARLEYSWNVRCQLPVFF